MTNNFRNCYEENKRPWEVWCKWQLTGCLHPNAAKLPMIHISCKLLRYKHSFMHINHFCIQCVLTLIMSVIHVPSLNFGDINFIAMTDDSRESRNNDAICTDSECSKSAGRSSKSKKGGENNSHHTPIWDMLLINCHDVKTSQQRIAGASNGSKILICKHLSNSSRWL